MSMPPAGRPGETATLHGWAVPAEATARGSRPALPDATGDLAARAGV